MTFTSTQVLRVMPREMRLMSERIFSLSGLPKGFFLSVVDLPMYSQRLGLGGFFLLEKRFEEFRSADPAKITILTEHGKSISLDAGGQHTWFVIPSAIDLLGELSARFGSGELRIENTLDAAELAILSHIGGRAGLSITVEGHVIRAIPKALTGIVRDDDPVLWSLFADGARLEPDLWWRIYHLAKKALATDSVVSRRHAGPMIVADDGTIIGRKDNDDDTDVGFLAAKISDREQEKARP